MRIILVGVGVVGGSFLKLIHEKRDTLRRSYGLNPRLVAAADTSGAVICEDGLEPMKILDVKRVKGGVAFMDYGREGLTALELIDEVEADVLIDATPTNIVDGEPSYSIIRRALIHGLNVITVSKGALAIALPALKELASYKRVALRFSGTVGGGLPVIEFAKGCALGDEIESIEGILNGTTNYILSRVEDGLSFEDALREAQEKGYAERDPSLDIEGYDTAIKLVILANEILRMKVTINDVSIKGITGIDSKEVLRARKRGKVIRLIGKAAEKKLCVQPIEIAEDDPLAVRYSLNAVAFNAKSSGRHVIVGKGAGGKETATAILRDLIYIKDLMMR